MTVLLIVNSLFFLSFIAAFCRKVHNAGNVTGLIVTIFVYVMIFFRNQIADAIIKCDVNSVTLAVVSFCIFLVLFPLVLFSIVMSVKMIFYAFFSRGKSEIFRRFDDCKVIIVLGCRVKGKKPTKMLMQRIKAAYREYMINPEKTFIIASGGKGDDEDISEAECIKNELIKLGADSKRIFKEEKSTNTSENIVYSFRILKEMYYSYGRKYDDYYDALNYNFVIVTNEFHMYRSIKIAEKLGFKAYSAPAYTSFYLLPTFWIRELLALFKYYIMKRIR